MIPLALSCMQLHPIHIIIEGTDFSFVLLSDNFPVKCCAIYSVTVNILYFSSRNAKISVKLTDTDRSDSF